MVVQEADPVDGAVRVGPRGRVAVRALVDDRAPEPERAVVRAREGLEGLGAPRDLEEEAVGFWFGGDWFGGRGG